VAEGSLCAPLRKNVRYLVIDISRAFICLLSLAFLTDFAAVSCLGVVRHGTFAAARNMVFVRWFQAMFRGKVDIKCRARRVSKSASGIEVPRRTILSQLHDLLVDIVSLASRALAAN
jgi:hypothetical protein